MTKDHRIICGDAESSLRALPEDGVDLIVASTPYFRHMDYAAEGRLGMKSIGS